MDTSFPAWIIQKVMFLRDKDWAGVVKTIHFSPALFLLWATSREACERKIQANQRSH
jgi:hypothetical protein